MIFRGLIFIAIILLVAACGEGATKNKPATLTFLESNVEQYLNGVPHNIPQIEIKVQEDLNPASVNNQTVHLMAGNSSAHKHTQLDSIAEEDTLTPTDPNSGDDTTDLLGVTDSVDGLVWFDSTTKTIIFQPRKPLAQGTTYHIRVHNVELNNGEKVTVIPRTNGDETGVIQFNFATTHDHEVLRVRYDKDGNETAYVTFRIENNILKERRQYGSAKELKLSLLYNEPLPSPSTRIAVRLYKDSEGKIIQYDYDTTGANGEVISLRVKEAGTDQLWGTEDDLVVSWTKNSQQHLSHQITETYTLVNKSQKVQWQGVNTVGFELRTVYLEEHAGPNFEHRDVFYRSLGNNNEIDIDPVTQDLTVIDDNISLWHKRDFFNGKRIRSWSINGIGGGEGSDLTLFTNDDIASGLTTLEYYPDDGSPSAGQLKKLVTYYSSSFSEPMNTWLVDEANNIVRSDAPVHSYRIFRYDNLGNRTEELQYSPGDDKVMATEAELLSGTADDYVTQRKTYSTMPTITGGVELGLN